MPVAELTLRLSNGAALVVPASLDAITTYVVLEQEAWFEKEARFVSRWLAPGMTAIDIGANHGVYALSMARAVAPGGRVFAYEPASAPRRLLEKSRELNRATHLQVLPAALSDSPRSGHLVLEASSELNRLGAAPEPGPASQAKGAQGEAVPVTCLDAEDRLRGWSSVDFIKIDAEGEEERIFAGGRAFFERHSPLVMFEVKAGDAINETLRGLPATLGYRVFRLLGTEAVLCPDDRGAPLDGYELNLFAAKPDRVAALARDGLLVEAVPEWTPDPAAREAALDRARALPFGSDFAALFAPGVRLDAGYRDALAAYAAWRAPSRPLAERCAALEFAVRSLAEICTRAARPARLSTLARVAWEAGRRSICVRALGAFIDMMGRGNSRLDEPFWPAAPRFDLIAPGEKASDWFIVAALEQFERAATHSSFFGNAGLDLGWLSRQALASREIERRHVLRRARAGDKVEVPMRLRVRAPDHVNAATWRSGAVPNTLARRPTQGGL